MSEFASTFLDKAGKRGFGFETGRHVSGKPGHLGMRGVFEDPLQGEMRAPPFARAFEGAHPAVGTAARLGNPLRFKIEVQNPSQEQLAVQKGKEGRPSFEITDFVLPCTTVK